MKKFKLTKTRYEEILDLESVKEPLLLRKRNSGDTISPLGTRGYKKVKKLFIDKKIPRRKRSHIPIIAMNNKPVWIVGICLDNSVKVTLNTKKILKLTFQPSGS